MSKRCYICKKHKDSDEFHKDCRRCKECQKVYAANRRAVIREYIMDYLKDHPCVDCGETDPVVLQFDHIRDKTINICKLYRQGSNIKRVIEEVKKCEIRCANCHTRKIAKEQGSYRLGLMV